MYLPNGLAPEAQRLASETFHRCWRFIEHDPVLAGGDRTAMQAQLAERILLLMHGGERDLVVIANRAIGALRQQYARQRDRLSKDRAA